MSDLNSPEKYYQKIQDELEKFRQLPEAQHQSELFTSWVSLVSIQWSLRAPKPRMYWCPKCDKWEELKFECGTTIEEAIELLKKMIPEHSEKVKQARMEMQKKE
jgi:hypothetical protein